MTKGIRCGDVYFGAMKFPDRKNYSLVVSKGNEAIVLGRFNNEASVEAFGKVLDELFSEVTNNE